MTGRHTLALGLVLVLMVALYFGVQQWRERREVRQEELKKVARLDPAQISEVAITQLDAPEVRAVRESSDAPWKMVKPDPTIPPHQPLWNRVVEKYGALSSERVLRNPSENLAEYGLDPPVLRVEFGTRDGQKDTLIFGDQEPTERFRYACRPEDRTIFLITREMFFEFNRSLDDLRHKFIVDNRDAPIRMIEFAFIWREGDALPENGEAMRPGAESVVVRAERDNAQSPWRLVSPVQAPADQEALDELAQYFQFGVVAKFYDHPENYADFGLDPPRARITLADTAQGHAQTFLIGNLENADGSGGLFIRRAGQNSVELVDPRLVELIPKRPTQWRETRLITRRVAELSEIICHRDKGGFTLKRDQDGSWRLVDPSFSDVSDQVISGYLAVVKETRGEVVEQSPEAVGLDDPEVRFTFAYADGSRAECRLKPDPSQADAWLATQDSGGVIRLVGVAAQALLVDPATFRSRALMRFDSNSVNRIEFSLDGRNYVLGRREGRWRVVEPEGWSIQNQADAKAILDVLSDLQCATVLSQPVDTQVSGLDNPVFAAVVYSDGVPPQGEQKHGPVRIGNPDPADPQKRFAEIAEREGQFLVSQEVIETVRAAVKGLRPLDQESGNNAQNEKTNT
ncbi:MAG TPA: DUF4340 domain-containing protein [Candidatus Hydrogenedentes bacterium]|nr:DUF4340 domain-containing protein [Candidatus Hydrogenedentota bacterium]